jgi:hypothetical protein
VLEGRGRRRVTPGHRKLRVVTENASIGTATSMIAARPGERVARRPLAVYEAVGCATTIVVTGRRRLRWPVGRVYWRRKT